MRIEIIQSNSTLKFPIVANSIKWQQRTDYSHYAIRFQSYTGRVMILDATRKGVRVQCALQWAKHHNIKRLFNLDCDRALFYEWFEPLLGRDYGTGQIFAIWLKLTKLNNGRTEFTCNELVLDMFNQIFNMNIKDLDFKDLNETEVEIFNAMRLVYE